MLSQRYFLAIILLSICVSAQSSLRPPQDYLTNNDLRDQQTRRSQLPDYVEKGDLICQTGQIFFQIKRSPQWFAALKYLKSLYFLYCHSSSQSYDILVFTTNLGMIKLLIYSAGLYSRVMRHQFVGNALKIVSFYNSPF